MKLTFVILTCDKQEYVERQRACLETWANGEDVVFLTDKYDPEHTNTASARYVSFFRDDDVNSDYVVFVDDDTYVNTKAIRDVLRKMAQRSDSKCFMVGNLCKTIHTIDELGLLNYTRQKPFPWPYGGAGFVLDSAAYRKVKDYVRHTANLPNYVGSDVMIGAWIDMIGGIDSLNSKAFYRKFPTIEVDGKLVHDIRTTLYGFYNNVIVTCHYSNPDDMRIMHKKLSVSPIDPSTFSVA